jgi:hypothetical protein
MKPCLGIAILSVAFFGVAVPARATTCAPAKLIHITVANATPGIAAGSFAAQPKNYYRIGSDKLRIEEALDAPNEIHGLVVVAEPNIWMANLYDGTGKHVVDPGPTFFAKAPVFGTLSSAKLLGLEFGCEADFIAANAPKPVRVEQIGDSHFNVYRIEDGSDAVEILEQPQTGAPAFARYYHDGALTTDLRYDLYSSGLTNDPSLFVPPSAVHYSDAGQ